MLPAPSAYRTHFSGLRQAGLLYTGCSLSFRTVRAGENGVTKEMILFLYRQDGCEVDGNLLYMTGMTKEQRRRTKQKWEKEHPGETYTFSGYTVSRDAFHSEEALYGLEEDDGSCAARTEETALGICGLTGSSSPEVERLRELVQSLPERDRFIWDYVGLQGLSQQEAADILGITQRRVSAILKRIEKWIGQDPELRSMYHC